MKTKRTILNYVTDMVPLIIVSLLGIFKIKIFIQVLGDQTLGLYQLFSQIMVYVALVDGGLSSAVLYSLYKPNIEDDNEKTNEILAGAFRIFSLIGFAVFFIAAIIAFFVPLFIKDLSFDYRYVVIAFLLFSISNVIGYFFVPAQALLEVKGKKYITNLCLQVGQIIQNILEIILLLSGWSFFAVLIMHSVIKLLSNSVIAIIFKKKYPEYNLRTKKRNFEFVKKIKDLIFHKVNGLVGSNIDIIIISKLLGLTYVAIYSTYNYIINMLKQILGKISSSMLAIIGNEMAKSKEKAYELLMETNSFMFFVGTVVCVPLFYALNGFIDIWYEGQIATSTIVCIAFVTYLFCFIIKETVATFVTAAGLFKETKKCAITDTIVNLTLSLILVNKFGMSGVLFATAISITIAEFFMKNIVLHKSIFKRPIIHFYLKSLKFFLIFAVDLFIGFFVFRIIVINNLITWFIVCSLYTTINLSLILLVYRLIGEADFFSRFLKVFKRG